MSKASFSASALVMLLAAGDFLFALSIILSGLEQPAPSGKSAFGPGSFSRSAIGYAGLYELLRRDGWQVQRSAGNVLAAVGRSGVLIMAEPDLRRFSDEDAEKLLAAPRILLVLPKWHGVQDPGRPGWLETAELAPGAEPYLFLDLAAPNPEIVRSGWPDQWQINAIGIAPTGSGTLQLMVSEYLTPLVAGENGILLGELSNRRQRIFVLSDPDVMANHGIVKGDNAAFMTAVLERLTGQGASAAGALVFDETVHGFRRSPGSPLQLLLRFPYVVVVVLLTVSLLLALWAAYGRFGPAAAVRPAFAFGKAQLIANSARLLDYSGYREETLRRYIDMTVRHAARTLHAPPGLSLSGQAAWLEPIGKARSAGRSGLDIVQEARRLPPGKRACAELGRLAWDIHCWKGEILDGYAADKRAGGNDQD